MTPVGGDARSDLAAAAEAAKPRPKTGVRAILASLHRSPEIAAQVRIETQALPPALTRQGGAVVVTALLTEGPPGSGVVRPPWGVATWSWPTGDFLGIERWDGAPQGAVDWEGEWPAPSRSAYDAVLDAIDVAGPTPSERDLAEIHELLRQAVPGPAVRYYTRLEPTDGYQVEEPIVTGTADSETVAGWAREASQVASAYGLDPLTIRLGEFRTERSRASFRASVVGEFNRGKSTLVNALLRRELLPTGPVPVTRSIVVVRAGDDEGVDIVWPDGRTEHRPLDEQAFAGLTLDHDPSAVTVGEGEAAPAEPRVVLTVDDDWLRSLDIELIDTPGTNERRVDRVRQVRRAVVLSDMVVLAVSVLSPLSMTERQLLCDEVLRKHVAHLVVVITMVDLLEPADRNDAVSALRTRIHKLAPEALVLVGGDSTDALRQEIAKRGASELADARNRRWALQIADVCDVMAQVGRDALAQRLLDDEARAAVAADAEADVRRAATTWQQIRLDLDSRRLRLVESVIGILSRRAPELTDVLFHELERVPDPGRWWTRDLPHRLRREFQVIATGFEGRLSQAVANDLKWLERRAAADLGATVRRTVPVVQVAVPEFVLEGQVDDLAKTRRLTRLAGPTGTLAALLAATGAGAAMPLVWTTIAATGAMLLAERQIADMTDQQRDEVRALLTRAVTETFRSFELDADRAVVAVYAQVLDGLRADQQVWRAARLTALARERRRDLGPDWDGLVETSISLARTIRGTLGQRRGE